MRYIENGIFDKHGAYFFDNRRFDVQSYMIFFDSTAHNIDLVGLVDSTDLTSYVDWDYTSEYMTEIAPLSEIMFINLKKFNCVDDFTMDSSNEVVHSSLNIKLKQFIDKINMYNQHVTRYDYYDYAVTNAYPFAELVIIKLSSTDIIVKVMLNKHITKNVSSTNVVYNLNSESYLSKYVYHYSTYESDYTNLYLKLLYNINDYETVNKRGIVISPVLYPEIMQDSSKLYMNIFLDSTVLGVANKYTFFDLTVQELLWLNNKYFCAVKDILDTTFHDVTKNDYTIDSTYLIEFLEFDTTADLSAYMGGDLEYFDFTKDLQKYLFNIRSIKKVNFCNNYFEDSTGNFFNIIFSLKTFYGYENRAVNEVAADWRQFFATANSNMPITYSGNYNVINNASFSLLSLLNSFLVDKFILPYDVTILKSAIENGTDFTIDLFITNASDITKFIGNWVRNGIYIFNERGVRDVMLLRANNFSQLDLNTFRLYFSTLVYDSSWFGDIVGLEYFIPSNSYIIQYKYHIYNVIPYINMKSFQFSNDLNNLITIHSFGYVAANPSVLQQNGKNVNV